MILQEQIDSLCPYCNEAIQLLIDGSVEEQQYIEDCQVCCRPILISMTSDLEGDISIDVRTEDD